MIERPSADDLDAHAPGGPLDLAHRGVDVVRRQVGQLDRRDLADLVTADAADGLPPRRLAPFSTPAALRSRSAAGGVLRMNENERSSKIVIWAGMIWPALSAVFSLYDLVNSTMLMPCGPERGADRRRRRGLAGRQLEGQDDADLLGHGLRYPF